LLNVQLDEGVLRAAARKSGQNVHTNCMGKASRGAA